MFTVEYYKNGKRCGLLVWTEPEGPGNPPHACGGFEPDEWPLRDSPKAFTVIRRDDSERAVAGWPHPEYLAEVRGVDGPDVKQLNYDSKAGSYGPA